MIFYSELASLAFTLALNLTILGFPIAAGIFVVFKLARFASARWRYVISVTGFFLAVLLPVVITIGSARRHQSPAFAPPVAGELEEKKEIINDSIHDITFARPPVSITESADAINAETVSPIDKLVSLAVQTNLAVFILTLWMIVTALLICREVAGHLDLMRRRSRWRLAEATLRSALGWSENSSLYLSDGDGPWAVGFFRPAAVIPEHLLGKISLAEMRYIAQHELAHAKWRDPLINALVRIIRASFWVSFPLWYLERVIRLEREAAADCEAILSSSPATADIGRIAAEYALTLVLIAKQSASRTKNWTSVVTAAETDTRSNLENRVRRLLTISSRPAKLRLFLAALIIFAGAAVLIKMPVASQPVDSLSKNAESAGLVIFQTNPNREVFNSGSNAVITNVIATIFNQSVTFNKEIDHPETDQSNNLKIQPALITNEALPQENDVFITENQSNKPSDAVFSRSVETDAVINRDDLTEEQINQMKKYAVSPVYVEEMSALGYKNIPVDTLIDMKRLGLNVSFISEMAAEGYKNLSLELLLDYRRHAVSPAYVREMKAKGYDNLSPQMLDDFKWHGVSTAYIEEMAALGYGNLTAKDVLDFRIQSVSTVFIREIRESVSGNISANQIVAMRANGVSRKFIDELGMLGYAKLTANQVISMKIHGVTVAFIEKIRARDSKNYSANELISMRVNGER